MGSKNNPGHFDCYASADPDEPMFVLLGRDRQAPLLVRLWVLLRYLQGEDNEKIGEAMECANNMEGWQRQLGKNPQSAENIIPALIARIEEADEHAENLRFTIQQKQKRIEELEAQVPRWIPVTERLPDSQESVLVQLDNPDSTLALMYRWCDRWWYKLNSNVPDRNITYWMPLPDHPGDKP